MIAVRRIMPMILALVAAVTFGLPATARDGRGQTCPETGPAEGPLLFRKEAIQRAVFNNCFLGGTQVAMADGSKKRIEDVQSGDLVASADPERGWEGTGKVGQLFRNWTDKVAYVTFAEVRHQRGRGEAHTVGVEGEGGGEDAEPPPQTVRCTPAHPWWVENEGDYVPAGELRPGDRLLLQGGREGVVVRVAIRRELAAVYNFEVLGWHTYYISDLGASLGPLVHNGGNKGRQAAYNLDRTYPFTGFVPEAHHRLPNPDGTRRR